jgi:hypothetical protein
VSTCVGNQVNGAITGTANVETGSSATGATLISRVFSGPTASEPCPRCAGDGNANDGARGGTCSSGIRINRTCDVNGVSPNVEWGATSLDCPPAPGGLIAQLTIDLGNTTGVKTRTLSAANPPCSAAVGKSCQCDTCNNAAATPCSTNADCGAGICGGARCVSGANLGFACTAASQCPGSSCGAPGEQTAPNKCNVANDCTADPNTPSPNDRKCPNGPLDIFCSPVETFQGCTVNSQCTFPGDTCSGSKFRDCFDNGNNGDVVTATGVVSPPVNDVANPTLAALFCIGPTSAPAVNTAAGLPGLGRLELGGVARGAP